MSISSDVLSEEVQRLLAETGRLSVENADLKREAEAREAETDKLRLALANTSAGNAVLTEQVRELERENAELRRQIEAISGSADEQNAVADWVGKQAAAADREIADLRRQLESGKGEAQRTVYVESDSAEDAISDAVAGFSFSERDDMGLQATHAVTLTARKVGKP